MGLTQSLCEFCTPAPHVLVQDDHSLHGSHPPFTFSGWCPADTHLPFKHHWVKGKKEKTPPHTISQDSNTDHAGCNNKTWPQLLSIAICLHHERKSKRSRKHMRGSWWETQKKPHMHSLLCLHHTWYHLLLRPVSNDRWRPQCTTECCRRSTQSKKKYPVNGQYLLQKVD